MIVQLEISNDLLKKIKNQAAILAMINKKDDPIPLSAGDELLLMTFEKVKDVPEVISPRIDDRRRRR